jgi:divalent metal cation (Fe/Co/Zn/Cd) transporter
MKSASALRPNSRGFYMSNEFTGVDMRLYRLFGIGAAALFALVGALFLFFPDATPAFFNGLSALFNLPESPLQGPGFPLILAAAYMYIVALLAFMMFRRPEQTVYPVLLANAKLASSALSLYLFLTHRPYLIYLANFCVDGAIGLVVILLLKMRKPKAS